MGAKGKNILKQDGAKSCIYNNMTKFLFWHPLATFGSGYTAVIYLIVVGHQSYRTIQPRSGRVSAFTSGPENKHHVEKVMSGTRYALTMGFTCDES